MIDPNATAIVYPNVTWQGNFTLGPYVVIGEPYRGVAPGEITTEIGHAALIRSHTVIYCGNRIGQRFQTGHGVLIREENMIGDDVSVGSGSVIEHHVRIGSRVRLHSNVFVPEYSVLEDDCWLGPNVVFTNAKYPQSPGVKDQLIGPHVERGARIGANATILPGIKIGREALVGAGAVVTKNVPAGSVAVGNPARIINHVDRLPYNVQDVK